MTTSSGDGGGAVFNRAAMQRVRVAQRSRSQAISLAAIGGVLNAGAALPFLGFDPLSILQLLTIAVLPALIAGLLGHLGGPMAVLDGTPARPFLFGVAVALVAAVATAAVLATIRVLAAPAIGAEQVTFGGGLIVYAAPGILLGVPLGMIFGTTLAGLRRQETVHSQAMRGTDAMPVAPSDAANSGDGAEEKTEPRA